MAHQQSGGRHQVIKSPSGLADGPDPEFTQGRHLVTLLPWPSTCAYASNHKDHAAPYADPSSRDTNTRLPRQPGTHPIEYTVQVDDDHAICVRTPSITPARRPASRPGRPENPRTGFGTQAPG